MLFLKIVTVLFALWNSFWVGVSIYNILLNDKNTKLKNVDILDDIFLRWVAMAVLLWFWVFLG